MADDPRTETEHADTETGRAKVAELVKSAHICMFTTMTADGKHVSRPMGLQDVEFDGDLWFFTYDDSNKAGEIRGNASVNVSFADPKNTEWTSISGTAEVVHDKAKAKDLWSPILNAWFADGLETEGLCLIKVHADSAEYWDGPSSRVVSLFGMVRAAITKNPENYADFDNKEVEL